MFVYDYRFAHLGGRVPGEPSPGADAADAQVASGAGGAQTSELGNTGASLADTGASPSGKARDFESRIRRFESFRPSQFLLWGIGRSEGFCGTLRLAGSSVRERPSAPANLSARGAFQGAARKR